ncbi:hypothetical protein [Actinoplanes rectilineatus]|uniref:hypothetical protein n=1 Tax=Actinoplanes rectilineatus TaxID=113571 RepID=UPI0005F2EBE4|nr:hypothetical protein [Actinoplanes rectilineatus]
MAAGDIITAADIATRVGTTSVVADSGNITTAQVVTMTVTAYLETNRAYAITGLARISSTTAGDSAICRIREDSLTGTEIASGQVYAATNSTVGYSAPPLYAQYVAIATGNKTFVYTVIRNLGGGNCQQRASAVSPGWLLVDLIPE